jgi:hypothetical protein
LFSENLSRVLVDSGWRAALLALPRGTTTTTKESTKNDAPVNKKRKDRSVTNIVNLVLLVPPQMNVIGMNEFIHAPTPDGVAKK